MNTKDYWESHLKSFYNLEGVGCLGLGKLFNLYKVRTLGRVARRLKISLMGRRCLM